MLASKGASTHGAVRPARFKPPCVWMPPLKNHDIHARAVHYQVLSVGLHSLARLAPQVSLIGLASGLGATVHLCGATNLLAGAQARMMGDAGIKILIIDEDLVRASILEEGLREAGYGRVLLVSDMTNLLRKIVDVDPDVIFIDLENPNRDVLEQMFQVSRSVRRPVAMFVDKSDSAMIEAAVDAGVSAYIVDGLKKERVRPILDMTISRFNAFNRLQDELENTKRELRDRKVIDRAKGILMKRRGLSEEEAYTLLRKTAMRNETRVADIARSLVTAAALLD